MPEVPSSIHAFISLGPFFSVSRSCFMKILASFVLSVLEGTHRTAKRVEKISYFLSHQARSSDRCSGFRGQPCFAGMKELVVLSDLL